MEKPMIDPQERVFTLNDVKQLYIAQRKRLLKWAAIGAIIAFLLVGIRTPKYQITATFKEGAEKSESGGALRDLLGGMGGAPQAQAAVLMKSFQVLKPLVEKLGLQVSAPRSGWIVLKVFKRYRDNLRATKGLPLADLDPFVFEDVTSGREEEFHFGLKFSDRNHFVVYTPDQKEELAKGVLGAEVALQDLPVKFTVAKTPRALKIGSFYPFTIGSWIGPAAGLRGMLSIVSDKNNKSIYDISIFNRDRQLGQRIVNELMHQYRCYLKREHDVLAEEQLEYLEKKQNQLYGKLDFVLDQNVDYMSKNMGQHGCFDLVQESASLLIPHQEMQKQVLAIEMELTRLHEMEQGAKTQLFSKMGNADQIKPIALTIQELKQQRDLLELSLVQISEQSLETRRDDLKEVRSKRLSVEKLMQEVDLGRTVTSCDLSPGLCLWANALENPEEREDFAEYLKNYTHLLSVREKMLQERFVCGSKPPSELEGIDLPTAQKLFVQYNGQLDLAEGNMRSFEHFKKEINTSRCELSSLSSVLNDPLSIQLIQEASQAIVLLKDEKYHSSKEGARYEERIAFLKRVLSDHLDQLSKVEELKAALIREKMAALQKISLDCINQQISVLHEQAKNVAKEQRVALTEEKKLLEAKMAELRLSTIPMAEKWRLEKWLEIKTELVTNMMHTITEIVESKTIAHQLHHVESKPLDLALLPSEPVNPRLYLMTFLGAFCFASGSFLLTLVSQILRGFPTTLEKLQALRFPALGSISPFCDGPSVETPTGPDLEILRRLALFVEKGKVIGLLSGRGPDYSFALSENLARMTKKSIVLRCDFLSKFRKEDGPGLLQIWKGELGELPIRKGKGFDYVTAGGFSPFGTEIIQSERFTQLIELLKKSYDTVFILCRTPLASAESTAALRLCDRAVVTVSGEQTEELTPFITWGYDENRCRLTFITQS